jgi:hypothetical protein
MGIYIYKDLSFGDDEYEISNYHRGDQEDTMPTR